MGLDIRMPIGLMFSVFGLLLTIFGLASDKRIYHVSLGININLLWGMILFGFGVFMLVLGRRSMRRMRSVPSAAPTGEPRRPAGH